MLWISKILFSNYLFLVPIFLLGVVTSFEDIKYGKIKNKWLTYGFLWGLGFFALILTWSLLVTIFNKFGFEVSIPIVKLSYLRDVFINSVIAFGVGFLMWHWSVWSAGDAKLFAVFAFLLPLKFYSHTYLSYFPSFALLLNIFVIALALYFAKLVYVLFQWILSPREIKKSLVLNRKVAKRKGLKKRVIKIVKEVVSMGLIFFVIVSIYGIFFESFLGKGITNFFVSFLRLEKWVLFFIFLALFMSVMKVMNKVKKVFYIMAILLLCYFIYKWIAKGESPLLILANILGITSILVFGGLAFRKIFDYYLKKKEIVKIKIDKLEPNMRLTEESQTKLQKEDPKIFKEYIGKIHSDGLTKEQVKNIQRYLSNKERIGGELEIYQPSPFAVWMFAGVIITIIIKGFILQPFLK